MEAYVEVVFVRMEFDVLTIQRVVIVGGPLDAAKAILVRNVDQATELSNYVSNGTPFKFRSECINLKFCY